MTEDSRLPWFQCHPEKLLNALAGLGADEGYLYVIVLLRIYEIGGPCPDTVQVLSNRAHIPPRRVERALMNLFDLKKLTQTETGLVNGFASRVLSEQQVVRKRRKGIAQEAAQARWGKTPSDQQNGHAVSMPKDAQGEIDLEVHKQESGVPAPPAPPRPKKRRTDGRTPIDPNWSLTADRLSVALRNGLKEHEANLSARKFKRHFVDNAHTLRGRVSNWEDRWDEWCASDAQRMNRAPVVSTGSNEGPDPRKFTRTVWEDVLKVWRITNNWNPRFGPEPGKAGCLVPSELLQPRLV